MNQSRRGIARESPRRAPRVPADDTGVASGLLENAPSEQRERTGESVSFSVRLCDRPDYPNSSGTAHECASYARDPRLFASTT